MSAHQEWKDRVFNESDVVILSASSIVITHAPVEELGYILNELRRMPSYSHPTLYVRYSRVDDLMSVYGKRYSIEMLSKYMIMEYPDHVSMISNSIDLIKHMYREVPKHTMFQLFNLKV